MAFYEEGKQTGRLLAKIVQSHQTSPSIGALHTCMENVVNTPDLIMQELVEFYSDLICSKLGYSTAALQEFLQR